ncbi:NADPH:quinone oxidoreductase family protein [Zhongshania aquimaris]|uniref:NADPH:quinone oxidoreductase family protein n=1 Tax=Zhongshania aquimaris TaxID=2857107 RepID=A0ABS6VQL2_9GAMM|nr:NADPH:quinone oxidoreductase family protein [Zhongshania aquimaris]MBW2940001.1 NADPH:quinone oxidoreductase family protein [Zhongshania aquimaris]
MKAIICKHYAPIQELVYQDIPDPIPEANEVVVAVKAAGVNFPDALIVQGLYQDKPALPFTPGLEFAGEILSCGKDVTRLTAGTRVLGFSAGYGAYAEQVKCHATSVVAIPDDMPFVDAANLVCAHGTAQHALRQRANIQPGETLVVLGAAGGTGIAAVQIGKAIGARVIAVCSSAEKLEIAKANGADELVNYSEQDLKAELKRITQGKGVDVVFDPVGGDAFNICSRCMARNGRLLVIGFASGEIPKLPVNLTLVKEYSLIGVFWGSFTQHEPQVFANNLKELFQWYRNRQIKVITDAELPLAEAVDALQMMVERKVKGKVVLLP